MRQWGSYIIFNTTRTHTMEGRTESLSSLRVVVVVENKLAKESNSTTTPILAFSVVTHNDDEIDRH